MDGSRFSAALISGIESRITTGKEKGKGKGRERQKQKQDGNDCRQNLRRAEPDVLYQLPN